MDFVSRKNEENLKITAARDLLEERLNVINEETKFCNTPKLTEIQEFYNGVSIFITGATGKTIYNFENMQFDKFSITYSSVEIKKL